MRERSVQSTVAEAAGREHERRLAAKYGAPTRVANGCAADDNPIELS